MVPETTDTLLEELGGCGLFQVIVTSVCVLMELSLAWNMMIMVFGGYNPGMTCLTSDLNQTWENNNNMSSQEHSDGLEVSASNVSLLSSSVSTYRWTTTCSEVQTCPDKIRFRDSASTVVTEWDLVCDQSWIISLIISVQMVGVSLGSLLSGQLATRYGRKITLYGGLGASVVFNVISALSVSWPMFTVFRFLSGLTIGVIFTICVVFNTEYLTQWGRGVVSLLPVWPLSNVTFALMMMALKNWRHVQYTTAGLITAVFLTVLWTPESMRWLAVNGKIDQAKQIPEKIARINKRHVPNLTVLENLPAMKDEGETSSSQLFPYVSLFRREFLKRTLVMSTVFFSMSTVYYAVAFGVSAFSGNFYINYMMLPVARIPVQFCAQILVTYVGRRRLSSCLLGLCILTTVGVVILQHVMGKEHSGRPTSILATLCFACVGPTWSVIRLWIMELYPTTYRSIAFGWAQSMARAGGIIAPYLIPKTVLPLYACFIILSVFLGVSVGLLLTLPETKGQALPDVKTQSLEIKMTTDQHQSGFRDMKSYEDSLLLSNRSPPSPSYVNLSKVKYTG